MERAVSSPELYARILCKMKEVFHGTREAKVSQGSWRKILLAIGVMLVFTLMVMLLLWNYKCIVVDHLCLGGDDTENPTTKDNEIYNIGTNDLVRQS